MVIIGITKDGFIVQMSNSELANLIGYYSDYDARMPEIGDQVKISKMYGQLYNMARMENELRSAAEKLREMANSLELVQPVIKKSSKGGD